MSENTSCIDHKAIGRRIAYYRKNFAGVGMSQSKLADRAGLTRHTIRNYENGRGMSVDSATRIACALEIRLVDLLEGGSA